MGWIWAIIWIFSAIFGVFGMPYETKKFYRIITPISNLALLGSLIAYFLFGTHSTEFLVVMAFVNLTLAFNSLNEYRKAFRDVYKLLYAKEKWVRNAARKIEVLYDFRVCDRYKDVKSICNHLEVLLNTFSYYKISEACSDGIFSTDLENFINFLNEYEKIYQNNEALNTDSSVPREIRCKYEEMCKAFDQKVLALTKKFQDMVSNGEISRISDFPFFSAATTLQVGLEIQTEPPKQIEIHGTKQITDGMKTEEKEGGFQQLAQ